WRSPIRRPRCRTFSPAAGPSWPGAGPTRRPRHGARWRRQHTLPAVSKPPRPPWSGTRPTGPGPGAHRSPGRGRTCSPPGAAAAGGGGGAAAGGDKTGGGGTDGAPSLSADDERLATLVAAGWSNADVARFLSVGPRTVEARLTAIYRLLALTGRRQLAEMFP